MSPLGRISNREPKKQGGDRHKENTSKDGTREHEMCRAISSTEPLVSPSPEVPVLCTTMVPYIVVD